MKLQYGSPRCDQVPVMRNFRFMILLDFPDSDCLVDRVYLLPGKSRRHDLKS